MSHVIHKNRHVISIKNGLTYTLRACRKSGVYCAHLYIFKYTDNSAKVTYYLSDGRIITQHWASYTVAREYFLNRSRAFKGIPLTIVRSCPVEVYNVKN